MFERGLYKEGMKGSQTQHTKDKLYASYKEALLREPDLDAHAVLDACPDFAFEQTQLEELVQARGHILLALLFAILNSLSEV